MAGTTGDPLSAVRLPATIPMVSSFLAGSIDVLTIRPLTPHLGAEVAGIDLGLPIDDGAATMLREAFGCHHLLLLRGQEIDEAAQIRFATLFGPVSHRGAYMKRRDYAHVSNTLEDGILGNGVLHFHSDHTFFRHPLKAICLFAIEIPASGGDTLFSNAAAAWTGLPVHLKERITGLRSLQLFDYHGDYNRRVLERDASPDAPRCRHPLMLQDDAGRTVLFVHAHTTAAIDGLSDAETDDLINELTGYIADPAIGYRHVWRRGDVIVWNNITLQHARTDFDPGQHRTLRRVPIAVSEAEAEDTTAF